MGRRERLVRWCWRALTRILFCSWQGHDYRGFFAGLECQRCGRLTPGVQIDESRAASLAASRAAIEAWFDRKHPSLTVTIRANVRPAIAALRQVGRQLRKVG